jgi:branched-chain amino acid transport system ATP-binding protein
MSAYIRNLNEEGMTFIVIEHGLQALVQLVERLVVLHKGRVLADGDPEDIVTREDVIDVYMGSEMEFEPQ